MLRSELGAMDAAAAELATQRQALGLAARHRVELSRAHEQAATRTVAAQRQVGELRVLVQRERDALAALESRLHIESGRASAAEDEVKVRSPHSSQRRRKTMSSWLGVCQSLHKELEQLRARQALLNVQLVETHTRAQQLPSIIESLRVQLNEQRKHYGLMSAQVAAAGGLLKPLTAEAARLSNDLSIGRALHWASEGLHPSGPSVNPSSGACHPWPLSTVATPPAGAKGSGGGRRSSVSAARALASMLDPTAEPAAAHDLSRVAPSTPVRLAPADASPASSHWLWCA